MWWWCSPMSIPTTKNSQPAPRPNKFKTSLRFRSNRSIPQRRWWFGRKRPSRFQWMKTRLPPTLFTSPCGTFFSGIDSYKMYGTEKKTPTARRDNDGQPYYDAFNTAALLNSARDIQFYHKAKLVPGVETLPTYLLWMNTLFE